MWELPWIIEHHRPGDPSPTGHALDGYTSMMQICSGTPTRVDSGDERLKPSVGFRWFLRRSLHHLESN